MSYPDSVTYLYSLGNEMKSGAKWNLDRMRTLLERLDHPESDQRLLHVAGTNGKGSTCAMIAEALRQSGLRTGLYTSPHLIEPLERIQIDGSPVTENEFAELFAEVHAAAEDLLRRDQLDVHPSYFETVTAMAFLAFSRRCDVSVIEVGLGGRLDATNVIVPELCVITPIAYDHEAYLGSTIESIASEKAGILKPGVPAVLAPQLDAADSVIEKRARELGCQLIRTAGAKIESLEVDAAGSRFTLDGTSYRCALSGRHQVQNAVTAIRACLQVGLTPATIQAALEHVQWPGRLERLSPHPDFILDGAHNPAGAAALAAYIREFYTARPVWIVYGAMRDKAIDEVAGILFPLAERLIVTRPDMPRALRPEAILQMHPHRNAVIAPSLSDAIRIASKAPPAAAVFFTGSLFLVGEARALLLKEAPRFVK